MALPATELDAPEFSKSARPECTSKKEQEAKEPRQSIASEWTRYRKRVPKSRRDFRAPRLG